MNRFFSQRYSFVAIVAAIIFISLLGFATLKDTLHLAIIGDDWLLLYTIRQIFEIDKSQSFSQVGAYLCTYCPHYSLLSIIKHFWGYDQYYYYLVSMIVRIGVGLILFACVDKLLKRPMVGLIAGALWVTTYQGIQSSDWVFNFNHYIGVGVVAALVLLYLSLQNTFTIKRLLVVCLVFCSAVIISPPRMHGLLPFLFLIEASFGLIQGKTYQWKHGLIRLLAIGISYKLLFVAAKGGYGTSEYNLSQILHGLGEMKVLWEKGQKAFLVFPIATIGNFLLPDISWGAVQRSNFLNLGTAINSFKQLIVPVSLFSSLFFICISSLIGVTRKMWKFFLITQGVWTLIIYRIVVLNRDSFSKENVAFSLIGGAMIFFTLSAAWSLRKNLPIYSRLLFVSLGWMIAFSILPWVLAPYSTISTWMRYSIQQAAGLALWMSLIFGLMLNRAKFEPHRTLAVITVFVGLLLFQISNTHSYIKTLSEHRSQAMVQPLWDTLHKEIKQLPHDRFTVVYLTYDDYYLAEWGLRFGFSSRAFIEYGLDKPGTVPIMTIDYPELVSFVTDGKEFAKHGYPLKAVPLSDVYAFELKKGILINKTENVRSALKKETAKIPF